MQRCDEHVCVRVRAWRKIPDRHPIQSHPIPRRPMFLKWLLRTQQTGERALGAWLY